MKELYGIDLPVMARLHVGLRPSQVPMVVRVPGWVNFGILKARAVPLPVKGKQRAAR